jgi:hypothetical protein
MIQFRAGPACVGDAIAIRRVLKFALRSCGLVIVDHRLVEGSGEPAEKLGGKAKVLPQAGGKERVSPSHRSCTFGARQLSTPRTNAINAATPGQRQAAATDSTDLRAIGPAPTPQMAPNRKNSTAGNAGKGN